MVIVQSPDPREPGEIINFKHPHAKGGFQRGMVIRSATRQEYEAYCKSIKILPYIVWQYFHEVSTD